jgi:uncharacterized repeat protein (TIGR04052 family)
MPKFYRSSFLLHAVCGLLLACGDDDSPSDSTSRADAGGLDAADDIDAPEDDSASPVDIDSDAGDSTEDANTRQADAGIDATVDASLPTKSAFSLDFAALSGGKTVGCGDALSGLGLDGMNTASIDDLRLYVSALQFFDVAGNSVDLTLDSNDFQLLDPAGAVSLIDLTGNEVGACNPDNFPESEGTKRVHPAITGTTFLDKVASIKFNVGLPQALMKKVIADNTAEGAPSPLAEMSWTWAGGYRFFVLNLVVNKSGDAAKSGAGYVHVGSTGCSASFEVNALSDRNQCAHLNTPAVALTKFSLASNKVTIDLDAIAKKLDFMAETYNEKFEVNGAAPGVACHSAEQGDCPDVFNAFGLSLDTGLADASKNIVFGVGAK